MSTAVRMTLCSNIYRTHTNYISLWVIDNSWACTTATRVLTTCYKCTCTGEAIQCAAPEEESGDSLPIAIRARLELLVGADESIPRQVDAIRVLSCSHRRPCVVAVDYIYLWSYVRISSYSRRCVHKNTIDCEALVRSAAFQFADPSTAAAA